MSTDRTQLEFEIRQSEAPKSRINAFEVLGLHPREVC
jgi:hypothetical protein